MVHLAGLLVPDRRIPGGDAAYSKLKHLDLVDPDVDLEVGLPQSCSPRVKELGAGSCTVDAEIAHTCLDSDLETLAVPPGVVTVDLPPDCQVGQEVSVVGPHGRHMLVELPLHAQPNRKLNLRLAPQAELRIQLPTGQQPGASVRVERASGAEILVTVPEGAEPGESLEAAPPVLMVAVPEDAQPGDSVVFHHHDKGPGGSIKTQRLRAKVPDELVFSRYFAARLPQQVTRCAPAARKRGWGAVLRAQPGARPITTWVGTLA
mmetsp:Transcript_17631/g.49934  ORF Transcript_17631/g.49934 Transcript_17631/m.49934 type:complete len:262 (+) Transcript_17631:87-872(+)